MPLQSLRKVLTFPISFRDRRSRAILIPVLCGFVGFMIGGGIPMQQSEFEAEYPLPHHVPKYPGNLTLRFAMVHDVIHERFPRHGPDYYQARNHIVEKTLAVMKPSGKEAAAYFRLVDDLAVGLEFLGRHRDAVALMRDKLKQQESLGQKEKQLYSTYANLSTFLILWQLSEGVGDVARAKARIGESVSWIRKAIEVYPQSHFGREAWQLVLEEFILAVLDDPKLLLRYDMIGNRLDSVVGPERSVCYDARQWQRGFSRSPIRAAQAAAWLKEETHRGARTNMDEEPRIFRESIAVVGADEGWDKVVATAHVKPVPFDEPTLGIVGMWRMGAGANPHFALALGEIMLRVGQRHIAWAAYERAFRLKEHYWPNREIQEGLGKHCRARQKLIQESIPDEDWQARLTLFEKELALGTSYQEAYQSFEAEQVKAGKSPSDPHFYDDFETKHGPIATPIGNEDTLHMRRRTYEIWPSQVLLAGLFALAAAAAQTLFGRYFPKKRQ